MSLRRLLTSRGFGVHSPLAFELITQVLCTPVPCYYATPSLPTAAERRWLRVGVRFSPPAVWRLGADMPGLDNVLTLAGARSIGRSPASFIAAVKPGAADLRAIAAALKEGPGVAMIVDCPGRDLQAAFPAPLPGQMIFSGRDEHYVVARRDLSPLRFNIRLR